MAKTNLRHVLSIAMLCFLVFALGIVAMAETDNLSIENGVISGFKAESAYEYARVNILDPVWTALPEGESTLTVDTGVWMVREGENEPIYFNVKGENYGSISWGACDTSTNGLKMGKWTTASKDAYAADGWGSLGSMGVGCFWAAKYDNRMNYAYQYAMKNDEVIAIEDFTLDKATFAYGSGTPAGNTSITALMRIYVKGADVEYYDVTVDYVKNGSVVFDAANALTHADGYVTGFKLYPMYEVSVPENCSGNHHYPVLTMPVYVVEGKESLANTSAEKFRISVTKADSITVTAPEKTEYVEGDTLDTTGMTVTATYPDGSVADVTSYAKVDTTVLNVAGEAVVVTVSFNGRTATFTVNVEAKVPAPATTGLTYENGVITGLLADASYEYALVNALTPTWIAVEEGATSITVDAGVWMVRQIAGEKYSAPGEEQYIAVKGTNYGSISWGAVDSSTADFKIGKWTTGAKDAYAAGGWGSLGSVGVGSFWTAKYENRMKYAYQYAMKNDEVIAVEDFAFNRANFNYGSGTPTGNTPITALMRIYVKGADVEYYDITVDYVKNGKVVFDTANALKDAKGYVTAFKLYPLYEVSVPENCSGGSHYPVLTAPVYVVEGKESLDNSSTEKFRISVTKADSITVTAPEKTEYVLGETLDTTGMVVTATYPDGSAVDVTADVKVDTTVFNTAGEAVVVTVSFNGREATFTVTVIGKIPAPDTTDLTVSDGKIVGLSADASYEYAVVNLFDTAWTAAEAGVTELDLGAGVWMVRQSVYGKYNEPGAAQTVVVKGTNYGSISWGAADSSTADLKVGKWTTGAKDAYAVGGWGSLGSVGIGSFWTAKYENRMKYAYQYAMKNDEVIAVEDFAFNKANFNYASGTPTGNTPITALMRIYVKGADVEYYDITVDYVKNGKVVFDTANALKDAKGYVTAFKLYPLYEVSVPENCSGGSHYPVLTAPVYVVEGKESLDNSSTEKFRISVTRADSITLTAPDKTEYVIGNTLDTTGMVVTATYSDGSTVDVTADAKIDTTVLNVAGEVTITVSFNGRNATFVVTVSDIVPAPDTTNLTVVDGKITGLSADALYEYAALNISAPVWTVAKVGVTELDIGAGVWMVRQSVYGKYNQPGAEQIVVVKGKNYGTISWGAYDSSTDGFKLGKWTTPLKSIYSLTGWSFNSLALALHWDAKYSTRMSYAYQYAFESGEVMAIEDFFMTKTFVGYGAGSPVGSGSKTALLRIYVKESDVEYYDVTTTYTTSTFTFDTENALKDAKGYVTAIALFPIYDMERPEDCTGKNNYPVFSLDGYVVPGNEGLADTSTSKYRIGVSKPESLTLTLPTKTEYFEGEKLNTFGMQVIANYTSGISEDVTANVTITPEELDVSGNVTVTYNGTSTAFKVSVKSVEELSIKTLPSKTSYFDGDKIDLSGLILSATLADGSVIDIVEGFKTDVDVITLDTDSVTVIIGSKTVTFDITVEELKIVRIKINTYPDRENQGGYNEGDELDFTGLTVSAIYNSGRVDIIGLGELELVYGAEVMTRGTTLTITYGEFTTSVVLTVNSKPISSISVETLPEKLDYLLGDTIDLTGLALKVVYEDATEAIVTEGFVTGTILDKTGPVTVEVLYEGFSTTFEVDVIVVETAFIMEFPTKLEYQIGEEFDPTGLTLYVLYSNGEEVELTEGFELICDEFTAEGEYEVVLKYFDFEESFVVTVVGEEEPEPEVPENIAEGTIEGTTVNWVITTDGTLTVSGAGEVPNYTRSATAPWYAYTKQIKKIVVADGITKLGDYCFYNLSKATAIEISTTVKFLGVQFIRQTAITEVTLTSDVTITANAFGRADNLKTLNLSEDVKNLQGNIFYQETVTIKAPENSFAHKYAEIYASKFASSAAKVTFESDGTTAKLPIVRFAAAGDNAFFAIYENAKGNWALEVSGIGVMKNFPYVSPKNIAKGFTFSPMYYIGDVEEKIGDTEPEAKIASITVKEGITTVGNYIFYKCTKATTLTLPEGITSIGQGAFRLCQRIAKITLPEAVTKIEKNAFLSCGKLVEIYIPAGVTTVGEGIFEKCDSVNSLVVKTKSAAAIEVISAEYPQVTIVSDF